jgi:hypothetical protein
VSGLSALSVEGPKITGLHPLALWVPDENGVGQVKAGTDIPADLAKYLRRRLFGHINQQGRAKRWLEMEESNDTCILTWVIGKKHNSHFTATRRACKTCTAQGSGRKAEPRPCALLERVGDRRMVIVLPLEEKLREGDRDIADMYYFGAI